MTLLVSCLWGVRVCVGSYNQSGLSLSGRGGVAGISLARMQCDTVTILMPNTYLITRSAKIWYPYRFLFSFISLVFFISLFSFLFFFWFFFFVINRMLSGMFPLCLTKDARLCISVCRMSYSYLFCFLFFFSSFSFFSSHINRFIHTYTLMYSYAPMCMCILCCTLSLYFKY